MHDAFLSDSNKIVNILSPRQIFKNVKKDGNQLFINIETIKKNIWKKLILHIFVAKEIDADLRE